MDESNGGFVGKMLLAVVLAVCASTANMWSMRVLGANASFSDMGNFRGGERNLCRTIGCMEASSISRESREIVPTMASTNLRSYYYVSDPNIPSQIHAKYVTMVSQAEALLNAITDSEEEQRQAEQQAHALLRSVPLFYKNPYTSEIIFFARVDLDLP